MEMTPEDQQHYYQTLERCHKIHRDLDREASEIRTRAAEAMVRYESLECWMERIDQKQIWTLGTLIGLLMTLITALAGAIYLFLPGGS
jgi:hypothetical protein